MTNFTTRFVLDTVEQVETVEELFSTGKLKDITDVVGQKLAKELIKVFKDTGVKTNLVSAKYAELESELNKQKALYAEETVIEDPQEIWELDNIIGFSLTLGKVGEENGKDILDMDLHFMSVDGIVSIYHEKKPYIDSYCITVFNQEEKLHRSLESYNKTTTGFFPYEPKTLVIRDWSNRMEVMLNDVVLLELYRKITPTNNYLFNLLYPTEKWGDI